MANYHGDIHLGDTIDVQFTTTSATTGAPTTLAGTPVISAYIGNSITQLTAGITLTVDLDGVTGLNNVRVVASGGNGYGAATNVSLVITTGTVGGTSAVGYCIGAFSIDCRGVNQILGTAVSTPATAGILDVNVKNINNVSASAVTTIKAVQGLTTADTITTVTTTTNLTNLPSIPANWLTAAGIAASALNGKGDWMVTYTQPTGFLAATFPTGTIANTTNITAGVITTVTNLTNAPTAGDFTATMKTSLNAATPVASLSGDFTATMKTSIGTAVAASAVASVTGNVGGNVVGSVGSVVGAVGSISGVTFPTNFAVFSLTAGGKVDIGKINGTTVNGAGVIGNKWGP